MSNLSEISKLLRTASEELAASNDRAQMEADKRDWEALEAMMRKHGISNVVGIMASIADDIGQEHAEFSAEAQDYELAREVLLLAANGTDLTYGNNPVRFHRSRQEAVRAIREARIQA